MSVECAHDSLVDTASLVPNPRNPNKHPKKQIELLAKIIKNTGWRNAIIISNRSGFVIKGHARLEAAKLLGEEKVPVDYQDYPNEAMEWADMVADNRIAELAEPSLPELKDLLEELDTRAFDMDLTGFDTTALEELMTQTFEPKSGLTDDDAIPEPKETICKTGDLWLLGAHRLLCGDSTKTEDVARLMNGEKADMVFTDPPYGINIVKIKGDSPDSGSVGGGGSGESMYPFGGVKGTADSGGSKPYGSTTHKGRVGFDRICKANLYAPIQGDDKPFDPTHLLSLAPAQILFGANYYASKLPDGKTWLVWDKDVSGTFSEVELLWTSFEGRLRLYRYMWSGLRREGPRKEELTKRIHPTQKPVGLLVQIMTDFPAQTVLDPYLGSGTTLIACEKLNRKCYGMEIEPHYCDVIIKRWEDYTGRKAVAS